MFHSAYYLLLLTLVPLLAWRLFAIRQRSAVRFSSLSIAAQLAPTLRQRLKWLPSALTLAAIAATIIGLARPRDGQEKMVSNSQGIAIEMVVDRSGSMQAMDFQIDGQNVDRLVAIKNVANKFVLGGEDLQGRFSDLIGLVVFAGYADVITPPTLDHAYMVSQLQTTRIVSDRSEDGTAIGDAIALAVEKLNALDARQKEKVKSKIIILLTDGENTAGDLEPLQAAELAATMGIKVYTIGVGTKGQAPIPVRDPFTGRQMIQWMQVNIDEETLTKVAEATNGKYFRATDTDSLTRIYNEIDKLERTEVEAVQYVDYRELAVQPFYVRGMHVPPILMIAFILFAAKIYLEHTLFRELI